MRIAPLLMSSILGIAAGCGGSSTPQPRTAAPPPAADDPSCPVTVPGTSVTAEDTDVGGALVFVTTSDAAEVRERVAAMAAMHNEHHSVHSRASAEDIDGGARLVFTTTPDGVGKLQTELRAHARHLSSGTCEMPSPTDVPAPGGHEGHTTAPREPTPSPSPPDPAKVKADLLAAEMKAYENARPVFGTYCASCHAQGGKNASAKKLGHFDMTTYPFGGHHAGEMSATMRTVLGIGGGKPTMPKGKPGVLTPDELAIVAAWADAFDAAHAGGAHEGLPGHGGHGGHKH
jgi:mono/diheme cytochrome c family protein